MKIKQVKRPLSEIVEKLRSAFTQVKKHVINRDEEIDALMYCVLCGGHLMLQGPPGVAKSLTARLGFQAFGNDEDEDGDDGIIRFNIQMMPNTQAEEIFGPMSIKDLREKEIIRYNTTGMLPSAHFAYIDEVYRGSDSVLTTMMGILNERTFYNGRVAQPCPLITAVGTTNFVSDRPELEAFHDRWLISCNVQPADSSASRLRILDLFLEDTKEGDIQISDKVSLSELQRLQSEVKKVVIPPMMKSLYEEMVEKYKRAADTDNYVSDRRYCQALRLIQASILVNSGGEPAENPDASNVIAAKYAIQRSHASNHKSAMDTSIQTVIGDYQKMQKEEPEIKAFEDFVEKMYSRYDEGNSEKEKKKQYDRIKEVLEKIATMPPEEQFSVLPNLERLKKVSKKLDELQDNLARDLAISII